jgi:flagellar basal body rod protein FlgG
MAAAIIIGYDGSSIAFAQPVMDAMAIAAASGLRARMEALDLLANNIANQSSPGYKADREFYNLYISPDALAETRAGVVPMPETLPIIERQWTDFSQGTLSPTGDPLHLALSGRGFFTVRGPAGPLYTRNGSFHLSVTGELQTREGYSVLNVEGNPVKLDTQTPAEVVSNGEVRQGGQTIARLGIVDFVQPSALAKQAGSYFRMDHPAGRPAIAEAAVHQGKLEAANHSPAEGAVRLVSVLRQFEMLQKAITIGAEMNRKAEEVARVGS